MSGIEAKARVGAEEPDWERLREAYREELVAIGVSEREAHFEAERRLGRVKCRLAWLHARHAALTAAYDRTGDYYCARMDARPEIDWDDPGAPDIPPPPEEAEAEAILAEIDAAGRHDRWPRHLHFSNI